MGGEIVIKFDQQPKLGWPCPRCFGWGHLDDGWMSVSQTEMRYRPCTPCPVCEGSGRVLVTPVPKAE